MQHDIKDPIEIIRNIVLFLLILCGLSFSITTHSKVEEIQKQNTIILEQLQKVKRINEYHFGEIQKQFGFSRALDLAFTEDEVKRYDSLYQNIAINNKNLKIIEENIKNDLKVLEGNMKIFHSNRRF